MPSSPFKQLQHHQNKSRPSQLQAPDQAPGPHQPLITAERTAEEDYALHRDDGDYSDEPQESNNPQESDDSVLLRGGSGSETGLLDMGQQTPTVFVWTLTAVAGISGMLFGCSLPFNFNPRCLFWFEVFIVVN